MKRRGKWEKVCVLETLEVSFINIANRPGV